MHRDDPGIDDEDAAEQPDQHHEPVERALLEGVPQGLGPAVERDRERHLPHGQDDQKQGQAADAPLVLGVPIGTGQAQELSEKVEPAARRAG